MTIMRFCLQEKHRDSLQVIDRNVLLCGFLKGVIGLHIVFSLLLLPAGLAYAGEIESIREKLKHGGGGINSVYKADNNKIVYLDEKQAGGLSYSETAKIFFTFYKSGWRHAQSGDFIFHYRKKSNMHKLAEIVNEIYETVMDDLMLEGMYEAKADLIDIYLMDDEGRWKRFLNEIGKPSWVAGFASGDEIFMHIDWISARDRSFAIRMLAHEITHIVFRRLFDIEYIPWLEEGIAQYEENKVDKYIKQAVKNEIEESAGADLYDIDELVMVEYVPKGDRHSVFYLQSERLVTFLYEKHGREKFIRLIGLMGSGKPFEKAVMDVYKEDYQSYKHFKSRAGSFR